MVGVMGNFVIPGGTDHGTRWTDLVAARGGINDGMKG